MKYPSRIERLLDAGAIVEWRPIAGFKGRYEVSSEGEVRSLARKGRKRQIFLKPFNNTQGYLQVVLTKGGKRDQPRVHRLVMQAFVGPCPENMEVNHIDEDKTNNCISNLEYVTHKQNLNHATRNARVARARGLAIESYDINTGATIKRYASAWEAQRQDGYKHGNISRCLSGRLKSHHGVGWRPQTKTTE